MNTNFPSAKQVAQTLLLLRTRQLRELSVSSGVPYRTLLKIRLGETPNPGIETVRKFLHLLPAVDPAPQDPQPTDTSPTTEPQGVA